MQEIYLPFSTNLHYDSFLPTAIREWNSLSEEIRNSQTFPIFISKLYANRRRPPSYFNYGPRTLQVLQTRLRLDCSSLNHHLSKKNIVDWGNKNHKTLPFNLS